MEKIKIQLKSTMIEVAWFISRKQDAFRCRRQLLKGRHAERMQVPGAVFLGHRVKNSMTVIEFRWRAILKEDSLGLPAAVFFIIIPRCRILEVLPPDDNNLAEKCQKVAAHRDF